MKIKHLVLLLGLMLNVGFVLASIPQSSTENTTAQESGVQSEEFEEFEEFDKAEKGSSTEEFDEFEEFDENKEGTTSDEFEDFEDFDETSSADSVCPNAATCSQSCPQTESALNNALIWVLGILAFTMLAGLMVRHPFTRRFRNLFLLAGVIVLGFSTLHHACPCMLSSFQNTILTLFGNDIDWRKTIWFLGLIPITYIFGQVWCGWVCHLGALQEFLHLPGRTKIFSSQRAQTTMKVIRWVLLLALVVQLAIDNQLFFCKIDPFKTVFDLGFLGKKYLALRWVLLILLLLSSLFIYRPFCKAACPVGLMLGLVSKIPGASILGIKGKCVGCSSCNKACEMDAITRHGKFSVLDNKECIACGDCMDSCKQKGIGFLRKSKQHPEKIECKNECSV